MRRDALWLLGALALVAGSLGYFVSSPFTGDDDYVLHNLANSRPREMFLAWNVDLVKGEGGETTWYEGFEPLARRYVRVVPSALMALEYRLFGSDPVRLKTVSLLLHLVNVALGFLLLRRTLQPRAAAAVVALVGLHPAAAECVGWFACQPILFAACFSLVAVSALLRLRETPGVGNRIAFVAASTAALFSYEAAVGVPLLLVALDWRWPARGEARRSSDLPATLTVLAAYPAYAAVALWNRAGAALTDASFRAGVVELLGNVRVDLANYVVKVLPAPPYGPATYAAIGSWVGAAAIAAVVAGLLWWVGPSRARSVALWSFAALLAPPLLTRAAVSVLNFPAFRQLYLPLSGLAVMVCAPKVRALRRAGPWAAAIAIAALVLLYQVMAPRLVRTADRVAQEQAGGRLEALLAGAGVGAPIVQVGQSSCGYSLHFDAGGREVWKLMPPTSRGGVPLLQAIDERTVEVRAPDGDALAFATSVPADPRARRVRAVPALLTAGRQRLGLATAQVPARFESALKGFELVFDRPLAEYVFIEVAGCVELSRWRP